MATLIWLRTKDKPFIIPFERAMLSGDDLSPLGIKGLNTPRYLIAEGNIIEGTVARW